MSDVATNDLEARAGNGKPQETVGKNTPLCVERYACVGMGARRLVVVAVRTSRHVSAAVSAASIKPLRHCLNECFVGVRCLTPTYGSRTLVGHPRCTGKESAHLLNVRNVLCFILQAQPQVAARITCFSATLKSLVQTQRPAVKCSPFADLVGQASTAPAKPARAFPNKHRERVLAYKLVALVAAGVLLVGSCSLKSSQALNLLSLRISSLLTI